MHVLNTLVVDDEPLAHDLLENYIVKTPGLKLSGHCWDVMEAFKALYTGEIDLILLDIKMPDINGMDFLKKLKDAPLVIFTTAYTEYAVESYELNAVDYLVKPFSYERFSKAVNKAIAVKYGEYKTAPDVQPPQASGTPAIHPAVEDVLFVRSEGKLVKINLDKLTYIESLKDYLQLFLGKERYIVHGTMKNLEEQLKGIPSFVRISKSHIVNLQYITEVDGNMIRLGNIAIPIGKTYKEHIHQYLNRFKLI